jgi:hypothetical protein
MTASAGIPLLFRITEESRSKHAERFLNRTEHKNIASIPGRGHNGAGCRGFPRQDRDHVDVREPDSAVAVTGLKIIEGHINLETLLPGTPLKENSVSKPFLYLLKLASQQ